jgi:hypothetical protein
MSVRVRGCEFALPSETGERDGFLDSYRIRHLVAIELKDEMSSPAPRTVEEHCLSGRLTVCPSHDGLGSYSSCPPSTV